MTPPRAPRPSRLVGAFAAALAASGVAQAAPVRTFHAEHVLGASLDVVVVGAARAAAARAAGAARAEIDRLERVLSAWRPDAELARINAGEIAASAPELRRAVDAAERWRELTGGAYDARLGAVSAARRAGDAAAEAQAWRAAAVAGPALGPDGRPASGVRLDLDGSAKGVVIDAALAAARRAVPQARGILIDLGGDLRCDGSGPGGGAWRVGVAAGGACAPELVLRLPPGGAAVAVSGAGERDLAAAAGARTSHLVTPGAAGPASHLARAAVTAPCAADADALATALCAMSPADGLALVESLPGVEARLHDARGRAHVSSGWDALVEPAPRLLRTAAPLAWPQGQAVTVSYEVPRIAAPKYYAPYLVIWITDADHRLVKTLSVLGQKPRYLESNYVWWRRYGRDTPDVAAIARPTRAPGRYTAVWDGSTDAGGRAAPGRYLVHVEAARQDGGHTYETLELTVGAGGAAAAAAPKDELGALRVVVGPGARAT